MKQRLDIDLVVKLILAYSGEQIPDDHIKQDLEKVRKLVGIRREFSPVVVVQEVSNCDVNTYLATFFLIFADEGYLLHSELKNRITRFAANRKDSYASLIGKISHMYTTKYDQLQKEKASR